MGTRRRAGMMFFIFSWIIIGQLGAVDVCPASPLTLDNSIHPQLALQENITGVDSFSSVLDIKSDRISFAIKAVKCLASYLTISVILLTLYFNSVYKRIDEGEDGFQGNQ